MVGGNLNVFKKRVLIICGMPIIWPRQLQENGIPMPQHLRQIFEDGGDPIHVRIPSLGAVIVATYLKRHGVNVEVKDWYLDPIDLKNYDIFGISGVFFDLIHISSISKIIKKENPECKIILGGPISWSYSAQDLFKKINEIDYIVLKEGEQTIYCLLTALENGFDIRAVEGIALRDGDGFLLTQQRKPLAPEQIVSPDWTMVSLTNRVPLLMVESARGCVYNCAFCSEVHYWGKPIRCRSVVSVIDELENNISQIGVTTFRFADSCFTAPHKRCMEICDAIINRLNTNTSPLKWSCFARITDLSPIVLDKMKAAGCIAIDIGMESGDETILQTMNKQYTRNDIVKAISHARNIGILTHCNVIVGFPGETEKSINATIETLNAAKPDTYHCMLLDIAPNTDLANNPSKFGIIGDRLSWKHKTMSSSQANDLMQKIINNIDYSCFFMSGEFSAIMFIA